MTKYAVKSAAAAWRERGEEVKEQAGAEEEEGNEDKDYQMLLYVQHSQALLPFVETYEEIRKNNEQLLSTSRRFNGEVMHLKSRVVILKRVAADDAA